MTPVLRAAAVDDVPAVLAFWSVAAEDAHGFWISCGYRPQAEWSRWVEPLGT